MKTKRILSALMALLLMASLPVTAFAEEYNIDQGSITVSADSTGQYVTQVGGVQNYQQTTETVITQTDSSTATSNTITVTTTGDAVAEFTLQEVNIEASGDAIAIGDSSAEITLESDNKLYSKSGSAVHVSGGNATITGSGSLEAEIGVDNENAKIGSHESEDMSGSIHITGNATVTMENTLGGGDGAAIGSGHKGDMSGSILIDGNSNVAASSQRDGAAIGSGYFGDMSGSITIGGSAHVTAESDNDGAGIGSGDNGDMSGSIMIGGNAKVTAESEDEGAGIGTGEDGDFTGAVVIKDNAHVTAESDDDGAGIGSGENDDFTGIVVIRDNAWVEATGDGGAQDIGRGEDGESGGATVVIGQNTTVNATRGKVDNEIHIDVSTDENGTYTVTSATEGVTVGNILYGSKKTLPTEPGTYTVTCVLTQGKKTYTVPVGELVIPEPETAGDTQSAPLYRVTDKDGKNISYKTEQKDGVLTITVDADFAVLTGTLSGISTLKARGTEKIVFVTKDATSTFALADLLEKGSMGDTYKLTHDGADITFTLGAKNTDVSDILEKA